MDSESPLEQAQEFIEVMLGKRLSQDLFWVSLNFVRAERSKHLIPGIGFPFSIIVLITIIVK